MAPTSPACSRRVTHALAASCTSMAASDVRVGRYRTSHTIFDAGLRSLGRLSENAGASPRHGPERSRAARATNALARAGLRSDGYRILVPGIRHSGVSDLPELAGVPGFRAKLGTESAPATFTCTRLELFDQSRQRNVLPSAIISHVCRATIGVSSPVLRWTVAM